MFHRQGQTAVGLCFSRRSLCGQTGDLAIAEVLGEPAPDVRTDSPEPLRWYSPRSFLVWRDLASSRRLPGPAVTM
jgi:hypothetical protein